MNIRLSFSDLRGVFPSRPEWTEQRPSALLNHCPAMEYVSVVLPHQGFSATECRCSPSLPARCPREVDPFDTDGGNPPPRIYEIIRPDLVKNNQLKKYRGW